MGSEMSVKALLHEAAEYSVGRERVGKRLTSWCMLYELTKEEIEIVDGRVGK